MRALAESLSDFDTLNKIMKKLRRECPWDKEQTHMSLLPYLDEECLELKDAVYSENNQAMREELGDVLLQVVFHAELARESGSFTMGDVIREICEKLIVRHPHVFKKNHTMKHTLEEQWENIKHSTKKTVDGECLHKHWKKDPIAAALYLQKITAKAKFDWDNAMDIIAKLKEETKELEVEMKARRTQKALVQEELGDLFFTLINIARYIDIDPRTALHEANAKFKSRWSYVREKCKKNHKDTAIKKIPMSVKESYWQEAKKKVH